MEMFEVWCILCLCFVVWEDVLVDGFVCVDYGFVLLMVVGRDVFVVV